MNRLKKGLSILLILLMVSALLPTMQAFAADDKGYWELVKIETTPYVETSPNELYKTENTVSGNTFKSHQEYVGTGTGYYTDDHDNCHGEYFEYTAVFSAPPEELRAGETLTVKLDVACKESKRLCFFFGGSAGARFGLPNQEPGGVNVYDTELNSEGGGDSTLGTQSEVKSRSLKLSAEIPEGSEGEERTLYYSSCGMQVEYIYLWHYAPKPTTSADSGYKLVLTDVRYIVPESMEEAENGEAIKLKYGASGNSFFTNLYFKYLDSDNDGDRAFTLKLDVDVDITPPPAELEAER